MRENGAKSKSMNEELTGGGDVYVVGGGRSLKGFNFMRLKGQQVIACNLAFRFVPWAMAVVFWDETFYRKYRKELLAFEGWKITIKGITGDDVNAGKKVVELDPNTYGNVNNTGHFALGVATETNADRIILLGYDMTGGTKEEIAQVMADGGMNFYHYPPEFKFHSFHSYVDKFNRYKDFPVFNATPGSALKQFPYIDIDTLI